jgi:hypothetical protein
LTFAPLSQPCEAAKETMKTQFQKANLDGWPVRFFSFALSKLAVRIHRHA